VKIKKVITNRPWILAENTLKMYRRVPMEVAVLPVGSTEPHNLHLPMGADCYQVEAIAERACEIAWKKGGRAKSLPVVPYGSNSNFAGFPGFIHLNSGTHLAIFRDVVWSLEKYGVRKLVIINGHGGNFFQPLLRDLWAKTNLFISLINWWQIDEKFIAKNFKIHGEHSDEMETSMLLHLCPELVNPKDADAGTVRIPRLKGLREGWVNYVKPWKTLTTNSGYGNPKFADRAKGRRFFDVITRKIARYLIELAKAKITPDFPY